MTNWFTMDNPATYIVIGVATFLSWAALFKRILYASIETPLAILSGCIVALTMSFMTGRLAGGQWTYEAISEHLEKASPDLVLPYLVPNFPLWLALLPTFVFVFLLFLHILSRLPAD
jgi:hypothetical protein